MNILYFLVGCSLLMALIFLGAFFWALKNGQHDDVYTPGVRMLFDDDLEVVDENPPVTQQTKPITEKTEHNHFSV